jgi:hypothetical protein
MIDFLLRFVEFYLFVTSLLAVVFWRDVAEAWKDTADMRWWLRFGLLLVVTGVAILAWPQEMADSVKLLREYRDDLDELKRRSDKAKKQNINPTAEQLP